MKNFSQFWSPCSGAPNLCLTRNRNFYPSRINFGLFIFSCYNLAHPFTNTSAFLLGEDDAPTKRNCQLFHSGTHTPCALKDSVLCICCRYRVIFKEYANQIRFFKSHPKYLPKRKSMYRLPPPVFYRLKVYAFLHLSRL